MRIFVVTKEPGGPIKAHWRENGHMVERAFDTWEELQEFLKEKDEVMDNA